MMTLLLDRARILWIRSNGLFEWRRRGYTFLGFLPSVTRSKTAGAEVSRWVMLAFRGINILGL